MKKEILYMREVLRMVNMSVNKGDYIMIMEILNMKEVYFGEYKGKGKYYDENKNVLYEGDFDHGKFIGKGEIIL